MTRGPVSEQAITWALPIAAQRGTVYFFRPDRESPCDFEIVSSREVVFVRVKRTRCFHRTAEELEADCREHVLRLRAVPKAPSISRELWVCSRYGRWRFFRVTEAGIEELPVPVPATSPGQAAA
ncbi:MAG: hypothetical protein A4E35_01947 [Methanoregula sp. PtaU1.Bin051]|nr:MAG: hypothetical protein A4E35_01947 [Methanoregula sp. PtaU1.Bin051]